ncbi:hypothetical protein [Methanoculleus taiwanensis]|uniref:hypothetical protein n=1 Tax=Methanoculleus taiwanensis TaxID=1550565 RepID=UPI000FFF003F|nr:hypothetical protein [Methanoculleus taiwanensis]
MILSHSSAIRPALPGEACPFPCSRHDGEGFATSRIWTEAGFLPPRIHRCIVDLLHCSMMEDEIDEKTIALLVSRYLGIFGYGGDYTIHDPVLLRRFAAEYGLPTDRRSDEAIARDVTMAVIGEYGAGNQQ